MKWMPLRVARNWGVVTKQSLLIASYSCAVAPFSPDRTLGPLLMHTWCKWSADGLGIQRDAFGQENLTRTPQCVFVSNHHSLLDILVIGSFLKRDYRWLAKAPLFKVPLMGWHMALTGHIRVHRGRQRHRNREIPQRIHEAVAEGGSILFFPEGTRGPEGTIREFRDGAFQAAVRENLPVVPIVLTGTGGLMSKGSMALDINHDHRCAVNFLPAMAPLGPETGDEKTRSAELRDRVRAAMQAQLDRRSPDA